MMAVILFGFQNSNLKNGFRHCPVGFYFVGKKTVGTTFLGFRVMGCQAKAFGFKTALSPLGLHSGW